MSFFKKLLPVAGAAAGFFLGGPAGSAAVNAALGSGIGTLIAGGDVDDAVKNAAIAGIGAAGLQYTGVTPGVPQTAGLGAKGTAARQAALLQQSSPEALARAAAMEAPVSATAAKTAAAQKGILSGISGKDMLIASTALSALSGPEEQTLTELQRQQLETRETAPSYEGRDIVPRYDYGTLFAADGGYIEGPGTGRSDDVKAGIFQNGMKVQEARLSDGEFVFTERAVRGLGNGDRAKGAAKMYEMMRQYERMA